MALEIQKQKRNTAYKVWIGDLLKSNISLTENRLNYVELKNKKLVRVNILATVIDKYQHSEKPYASLTLDDSSGQIRAKTFEDTINIKSFNIGDSVRLIGTVRYFNDELYIQPEIIKKVDEKWLLVRKLEIGEPLEDAESDSLVARASDITPESNQEIISDYNSGIEKPKIEEIKIKEEKIDDSKREMGIKDVLMSKINENSDGIDIDNLIMAINFPVSDINSNITELIEEGRIYEPQPGRLRTI